MAHPADDESCPLLAHRRAHPTPLPTAQLAILCTVRAVEPIAFTQLFPYVNEFISDLHLTDDPSRVGIYSGLVESAFAIFQLLSIYQWARLSDIVGRRPVILAGILGTAISTIVFGLCKSFTPLLIARCISGLSAGNIAVIHSVLGEITDGSNQAAAFPIYGLMWPLGAIVGPLIGGSFSHPAQKYPLFFANDFWSKYPYFLPCLISGVIAIIGVVLGYRFLDESHPRKRNKGSEKNISDTIRGQNVEYSHVASDSPMNLGQLLSLPIIRFLVMSGFTLSFLATAFDVVFVLFCFSPVHSGGLAFSAAQIGYSLAGSGMISAAFQVFIMSYLLRTFDCAKMYHFCLKLWPWAYAALPLLNFIARYGTDAETGQRDAHTTAILWTGIVVVLAISRIGSLPYSLSMILIKANAPSPAVLGQSHSVVQFAMCSARSFTPFLVSSLFALSIKNPSFGGHSWVLIMVSLAFSSSFISQQVSLHSKRTVA